MNFLTYSALPLLTCILCNVGLILIVLKSARTVHKTTIIMIISLSVLLTISWLPVTVYAVVYAEKHHTWYRVINYMIPLDMTLSPLTYCYFNVGFRGFVRRVLCREASKPGTTFRARTATVNPCTEGTLREPQPKQSKGGKNGTETDSVNTDQKSCQQNVPSLGCAPDNDPCR